MAEPSQQMHFAGSSTTAASLRTTETALASADAVLLRPHVLTTPLRLVAPPSWVGYIPFAFWIVDALKPSVFVELGTHSGNSYSAFAQAVRQGRLTTACYGVDTWKGDAQAGTFDESIFEEWSAFHDSHFSSFSRLLRSTFDDALPMFGDRSIDLLHIDGLHTYEAVRHDFETWLPKLSPRAVVLLHDINVRQGDCGAWRYWDEIRASYPTFTFLHGHGLGVVGLGDGLPAAVQWLVSDLARAPRETVQVRQFFARLGTALEQDVEIGDLQRQRNEAMAAAATFAEQVRIHEAALAAPTRLLQDKRAARARDQERAANPTSLDAGQDSAAPADGSDDDTNREFSDVCAERDRLRETIGALEEERAMVDAEAATLRITATTAQREQRAISRALATTSRELKTIHASRAWRMTAPLRRIEGIGIGPLLKVRGPRATLSVLRLLSSPRRLLEARRVTLSGLFDDRYYRARYADVNRSGVPAVAHYVTAGAREGRSPHPLFDGEFYRARYEDVRASNANPLLHYARTGAIESYRDPHPLFWTAYYLERHPELPALRINPLLHYLGSKAADPESPHPLFDAAYYLEQNPEVVRAGVLPLLHFVEHGGRQGRAPHPLFDTAFYLRQNADVRASGLNPLVHYLEHVPGEDRDPHPLFDSSFYLDAAPELVTLGINPLLHFVEHGWREGRRPNPAFDPRWYLEMNPDVAASGQNPLDHFARLGWREGRDPCPEFSVSQYLAAHPDIAASNNNPLQHYLLHGVREGRVTRRSHAQRLLPPKRVTLHVEGTARGDARTTGPTIVCLTHVIPFPPRAGNEYRLLRLLEWLVARRYRVVLLMAPLPTETVSPAQLDALVDRIGNVVVCTRDGGVRYRLESCPDALAELDGRQTPSYAARLGERSLQTPREQEVLRTERTYCHDAIIDVTQHLVARLGRVALLTQYVWMTRLLPLIDAGVPKILDTIDMYSTKADKVLSFGASDIALSAAEEATRLGRADLVLAIQDRERALMQALVPATEVITVGVDFDAPRAVPTPEPKTILLVASGNELNRIGVRDFLRFAWPTILAREPEATLIVAGQVGRYVPDGTPRLRNLGTIDDVVPLYARARVVINPAAAGTGLKIKTVEALSHGRPVVTWPNGFDGIPDAILKAMPVPGDWLEFAEQVVAHLAASSSGLDAATQEAVRAFTSPSTAYEALGGYLTRVFPRSDRES